MQDDLDANSPELDIQILGVNEAGNESGNGSITSGRDIPWLQDVDGDYDGESDVWTSWDVAFRDVVIVDAENARVGAFNLTTYDLQVSENYDMLRQMLVEVASVPVEIPTVSQWGLILMAVLLLGSGTIVVRTRRRVDRG